MFIKIATGLVKLYPTRPPPLPKSLNQELGMVSINIDPVLNLIIF